MAILMGVAEILATIKTIKRNGKRVYFSTLPERRTTTW